MGGHLFRTADDPNDLAILVEWDSVENAQGFTESEDLREAMERASVGSPNWSSWRNSKTSSGRSHHRPPYRRPTEG